MLADNNEDDNVVVYPEDSASQAGRQSTVSSTAESIAARRVKLASERALLEARLASEDERKQIELEELHLKKRKEEMELRMKLKMMESEEKELRNLGMEIGNQPRMKQGNRPTVYDNNQQYTATEDPAVHFRVSKMKTPYSVNVARMQSVSASNEANLNPNASESTPRADNAVNNDNGCNDINLAQLVLNGQQQQRELIDSIRLPTTQLPTFDGDPLKYWSFVRTFDNVMERGEVDSSQKLVRLVQACTERARKVIECCLVMDAREGYKKARELLLERFGDNFMIANAWVTKITKVKFIRDNESQRLQEFADDLKSCLETLSCMGYIDEANNQTILLQIIEKLPNYLQHRFRREARQIRERDRRSPRFSDIVAFARQAAAEVNDPVFGSLANQPARTAQIQSKEMSSFNRPRQATSAATLSNVQHNDSNMASREGVARQPPQKCVMCEGEHSLFGCQQFKDMNVEHRTTLVNRHKLCFNCLKPHHTAAKCNLNRRCTVPGCGQKHTKFLHNISRNEMGNRTNSAVMTPPISSAAQCMSIGAGTKQVSLPVIPVLVRAPGTQTVWPTYALVDSCSTNSFCSQRLANQLHLKGSKQQLLLTTLNEVASKVEANAVSLEVMDLNGDNIIDMSCVYTSKTLSIPREAIVGVDDIAKWPHLQDIPLPNLHNCVVELLIGQDAPEALMPRESISGPPGSPYAVRYLLGWTLNGPVKPVNNGELSVVANFIQNEISLVRQMEKMFQLDLVGVDKGDQAMSLEDKLAVNIWKGSIRHVDEGSHYEVAIPFRDNPPRLPDNKLLAMQRLEKLRSRLVRQPETYRRYAEYMHGLLEQGYAEKAEEQGQPGATWYLPHHAVFNANKPDKIRVVFDCSAKQNNVSLNDVALQGPDMTNKLIGILIRFRKEKIAFMADIEAMFYQVHVPKADRDVLRFLWWPGAELDKKPVAYRLTVHPFGGVWSPSCCSFTLRHTASEYSAEFGEDVAQLVYDSFYVDDFLRSVATAESAVDVITRLRQLLVKGGFRLHKWISCSREVMSALPKNELADNVKTVNMQDDLLPTERALGVKWDVESDCFLFDWQIKDKPFTRRGVLSVVSSIYDPLGIVSPFTLIAKQILQELCRVNRDWDANLAEQERATWVNWLKDLARLKDFRVARCTSSSGRADVFSAQLHHFSDASRNGYGTASYLVLTDTYGHQSSSLIMAKSRVTPLKQQTIPRLELTAAVLAVKVDHIIRAEIGMQLHDSQFWTDSTVVLQYIRNTRSRFHTFVANRIAAIHEGSTPQQWHYVDTKQNPADDASRGLRAGELIASQRWLTGPEFLLCTPDKWPADPSLTSDISTEDPEVRKAPVLCAAVTSDSVGSDDVFDRILRRRSDWSTLKRDVAWMLRARMFLMSKAKKGRVPDMLALLSVKEIDAAELQIVTYIQRRAFATELATLQAMSSKLKSSCLFRLNPFIAVDGVLRIGGRLPNHPAILPKNHHVVTLIIRHYHNTLAHAGREHVLSAVRSKYWIIGARTAVRQVGRDCRICRRLCPQPLIQRMSDLPDDRIMPGRPPFTNVGVDLFGPFTVKRGRTVYKRYGCLFTCLCIRAIHIEVVHTLEADSFIQALQRFISRRGQVQMIRSDNGTNFVGACKEIRAAIANWNNKAGVFLHQKGIEWRFNTPAASHMGGVWERQIRTVRKLLNALMREQSADDESLCTLMCMVEAIVNSRPLTVVSDDPTDLEPLTPNHLLLLRAGALPFDNSVKQDQYSRKRWRQVQYLSDVFWRRWTREYLPSLQLRHKWHCASRNLQVGDVVILMDDNTPRNCWPLGRVTATFPGSDGLVRTVTVRTKSTSLMRPVHKLCLLEQADT